MSKRTIPVNVALAVRQNKTLANYWLGKFDGYSPALLPSSRKGAGLENGADGGFRTLKFTLPERIAESLSRMCKYADHTLHIMLLTAWMLVVRKVAYGSDLVVGMPVYDDNGSGSDLINTMIPVNVDLQGKDSFRDAVMKVKDCVLEAVEHQNFPIEYLLLEEGIVGDATPFMCETVVALRPIHRISPPESGDWGGRLVFHLDDDDLNCLLEYREDLYESSTMAGLSTAYVALLAQATANTSTPVGALELVNPQEKDAILNRLNDTSGDYPGHLPIPVLFQLQAERTPHRAATIHDQGAANHCFTYRELERRADELCRRLVQSGVGSQGPVAVMMDRSPLMLAAILAILKAGGFYVPVNPNYPPERKVFILRDSYAQVVVVAAEANGQLPPGQWTVMAVDASYPPCDSDPPSLPEHSPRHPAYVMYTSGSTGAPKGVMVEQRSVARLVLGTDIVDFHGGQRLLQTGDLGFDASTFEIWGALLNGLTLLLAPKEVIIQAGALKRMIHRHDVAMMWMTSPLFNQMVQEDIETFAGVKTLLVGGDVLSHDHIRRAAARFGDMIIINGYGPTENTTFSTVFKMKGDVPRPIPIGRPIANSRAYVVDNDGCLLPAGVPGELWVAGHGVARGYMNNPLLTAQRFLPDPFDPDRGRVYKTGDVARLALSGEIEFLNRRDQQVKIRGFRVEPLEIEAVLRRHADVLEVVVLTHEDSAGEKYLLAYIVADRNFSSQEAREYLGGKLPDFMVPSRFVLVEKMPLNANGKVDRRQLASLESIEALSGYIAPDDPLEVALVEVWSEILGIPADRIGVDTDFIVSGGHSIKAMKLVSRINRQYQVDVPLIELFNAPTIREMAGFIRTAAKSPWTSLQLAPAKDFYLQSSAQRRLYIMQQANLHSTAYNISMFFKIEGRLEKYRLQAVFNQLISRHEALRTAFDARDGEPVQIIRPAVDFHVQEMSGSDVAELEQRFVRPFDLADPPLLRASLGRTADGTLVLMVDMHHIISDGVSMQLLIREFYDLYDNRPLPPLEFQYKDYSEWQNHPTYGDFIQRQESYWLETLADAMVMDIPLDFLRPKVLGFETEAVYFDIGEADTLILESLVEREKATLFMILLALFNVFLSKLSGVEDVLVGVAIEGRRHEAFRRILGMFVNMLVMRNRPLGSLTFVEFVRQVKSNTLEAFENQDFQFESLVDKLKVKRDPCRNPLFDIVFELRNSDGALMEMGQLPNDMRLKWLGRKNRGTHYDLILRATRRRSGGVAFMLEYAVALFRPGTIAGMVEYFKEVAAQLVRNGGIDLPLAGIGASRRLMTLESTILERDDGDFDF